MKRKKVKQPMNELLKKELLEQLSELEDLEFDEGRSEEDIQHIAGIVRRLKENIGLIADNFVPDAEELSNNTQFKEDFLYALSGEELAAAAYENVQGVTGTYTVIKTESLAEQMRVEQFLEKYYENPYQLNLI